MPDEIIAPWREFRMSKCLSLEMKQIRQREKMAQPVEVTWLTSTNPSLAKSIIESQSASYTSTVRNLTPQISIYKPTYPGIPPTCAQNSPPFPTLDPEDTCTKTKDQSTHLLFLETNRKTVFYVFLYAFLHSSKNKKCFHKNKQQ